jgi:hypothetical protein
MMAALRRKGKPGGAMEKLAASQAFGFFSGPMESIGLHNPEIPLPQERDRNDPLLDFSADFESGPYKGTYSATG